MGAQGATHAILLVDDDKSDRLFARKILEDQPYIVFEAINGRRSIEVVSQQTIDLILLDLKLPGENGLDLIDGIRRHTNAPIIIVSGQCTMEYKKNGLDLGADDYITKPFYPDELRARIQASLRRYKELGSDQHTPDKIDLGTWTLDLAAMQVYGAEKNSADLTAHEFDLLKKLVLAEGRVLAREELTSHPGSRGIDVQITRIRKKLADPGVIQTVRGVGYRLNPIFASPS